MNIFVTGSAGFIGYHLVKSLLINKNIKNNRILSIDNFDNYYDKKIKLERIKNLNSKDFKFRINHKFKKIDLKDKNKLDTEIRKFKPDIIIHLAAQAGVRLSLINPHKYLDDNIKSFLNILEISKKYKINKIIYASSSSVYGSIKNYPYSEKMIVNKPKQFYAVTKIANELMAQTYSDLYNLQIAGIRFFTVYGPYGRPDMAIYKFTENILKGKEINVFNNGNHYRDFTYIEDAILGINNLIKYILKKNTKHHQVFNIGNARPIKLSLLIKKIEKILNKKAKIKFKPMQKGEVHKTFADTFKAKKYLKFKNRTDIDTGLKSFIKWYKNFHNLK